MTREEAKTVFLNRGYVEVEGGTIYNPDKWREACVVISEWLEQESKTDKYEYHTDHTDCIWYGNDSGCPVTCSQYRDGWNDAMDYIFKNGKGYQPYRHDG